MEKRLNKEQKRGISLLIASKGFERLSFYLIMVILIEYLVNSLNIQNDIAAIYYTVFLGAVGATTLISGLFGDIRNRVNVVKAGFILIVIFYLAMLFIPSVSFAIVLSLISLGAGIGLIAPNIIVLLGDTYKEKENEVIGLTGFLLFHIVINIGAFIAPLLAIFLKDNFGYSYAVICAFVSALIALLLFLEFQKQYKKLNVVEEQKIYVESTKTKSINSTILIPILALGLLITLVMSWGKASMTAAGKDYIAGGFSANQLLSIAGIAVSIIILLGFVLLLTRLKTLNWANVFNVVMIGLVFPIIAFILIASFSSLSQLIGGNLIFAKSYTLLMIAETLILPAITYAVYKSSPIKYKGFLQGILYVVISVGTTLSFLGTMLYEMRGSIIFFVISALLIIAVLLIMTLKKIVLRKMV